MSVVVVGASSAFGQDLEDYFGAPGVDSQKATDLLSSTGSDRVGLTAQVVVSPREEAMTFFNSDEAREGLTRVQAAAAELPRVLGTSDPAGALAAGREWAISSGTVSPDGRTAVVRLQYPVLEDLDPVDLENLKKFGVRAGDGSPLRIELGGDLFFAFEDPGAGVGEMLGLVLAVIILLVAFGSVVAMGLPIAMALFGLALGITSMSLISLVIDIPSWATVIGSMVGLGVGIDYALLIVSRHREFLALGLPVEEAVGRALSTAGQSVVFAGGTVVIAILGLVVAGVPVMTAGGVAISFVVLVMVLAAVTLLPACLGLVGPWVNRLGPRRRRAGHDVNAGRGWRRWGEHVSGHAPAYAVGAALVLVAMAAPVLDLRMGTPDEGSLPERRTERRAYDMVAEGFGPGVNGPLVIAVDISQDASVLPALVGAVQADDGIASVAPPEVDANAGVATVLAVPTTGPQDDATMDTVGRLRADVFPAVLDGSPARAHIGGQTANFADVGDKVNQRLPWFIGAVVLVSVVLLTLVFRSVLVPLKAAIVNLLSIGASFGVMVMVFQWGWGADVIGLESTVPIIPFVPMFMFAIVFGLSMDYEVFLLSRIREEYLASGDNETAVVRGIARTGRVITSAALIMICVFLGFVASDDPTTKMFGLGLATAIAVDATLVRLVLVPALMKLLGDANWWLPGWLDRLLPAVDLDGDSGLKAHDPVAASRPAPVPVGSGT